MARHKFACTLRGLNILLTNVGQSGPFGDVVDSRWESGRSVDPLENFRGLQKALQGRSGQGVFGTF